MTRDVFSIFKSDVETEKLFNQKRDIIYYRRDRFYANTVETLIILCMHTEEKYNVTFLSDIIDQNINLNRNSDTKTKANNQRDKRIYVEAILFNSFEFFSVEIENLINVENQKSKIDYMSENDRVLESENESQNELNSQEYTGMKKFKKRNLTDQFSIEINNKRNV